MPVTETAPAAKADTTEQPKFEAPDISDWGKAFDEVNVAWSGELGNEVGKVLAEKSAASEKSDSPATKTDASASTEVDQLLAELSEPNPAASTKESSAVVKATESELADFNIDTLAEDDVTKVLDSLTAKRLLGPRVQSERDKSYTKGFGAGRAAVEQEVELAKAAGTIDFDDAAKQKAMNALHLTRTQTAQNFISMLSDSLGSLAEELGSEREVASLEGKTFTNMNEYVKKVITEIYTPVIADRVKREAAAQAKVLAKAALAKHSDLKRGSLPHTPDFIPSTNPTKSLNAMIDYDKAYAAGEIGFSDYMKARQRHGIS